MKLYLLLLGFTLGSCSSMIIERPDIKGTIYDEVTKTPIRQVSIYIDDMKIMSDKKGDFFIKGIQEKKSFNFESGHDPMFYSIELKHPSYNSINIKKQTRGNFSQKLIVYDSIFLKPINNTTLPNNGYK